MRLLVVFVSASDAVIDAVVSRRVSLVPSDIRANAFAAMNGEEVTLSGYKVVSTSTVNNLLAHISNLNLKNASSVIILTDNQMPNLAIRLGDIFSVNSFVVPTHGQNVDNILRSILSKNLRVFQYYKTRFDDLKYQQILRLPLRNFAAQEIAAMRAACHGMASRQNFGRELDALLERFRAQRQKPKKASTYHTTYLVDDDNKYFNLGHEIHARAGTAMPPHNDLCALANAFRFGRTFNGERHFNVTQERDEEMCGDYLDCHGVQRGGDGAKHLNMFTNDFF